MVVQSVPAIAPDQARILILDFGSQYTQLIARRVRETGVYSEIHPFDVDAAFIAEFAPQGIILSGGPESVAGSDTPRIDDAVIAADVPILGICYGMQALADKLGGTVEVSEHREFGYAEVELGDDEGLLHGLGNDDGQLRVWMSHGDRVAELPPGFTAVAASANAPFAAMANHERRMYGLQFHPEVTHTDHGLDILRRFAIDICECSGNWTSENIIAQHVARIRAEVGNDRVLLGLSGGVDSSVVAALLHEAIGDQLFAFLWTTDYCA